MSLSIPFPFWVTAEQKGGRVDVNISLAFLLLGRDNSPPLAFRLCYSQICAEKGRYTPTN